LTSATKVVDRQVAGGVRLEHGHGDRRVAVHRDLECGVVESCPEAVCTSRRAGNRLQVAEGNAVLQRESAVLFRERDRTLISKINADRESQPAACRKPDRAVAAQLGDRRQVQQLKLTGRSTWPRLLVLAASPSARFQRQFIGRGVVVDDVQADDVDQLAAPGPAP